jgi:hypothetical protein
MTSSLLLGPACRAAVIVRTFLDPEREFYLRELVRLSGFALRTVQEEVDRLVAADLLTERRHGNRRYLSANKRHPLFRPVREIVLKTDGLVNVLRDALGVKHVDFAPPFGSIASDTPSAASYVGVSLAVRAENRRPKSPIGTRSARPSWARCLERRARPRGLNPPDSS